MHLYCNYAREHWTLPGENPPVGLILCEKKDAAVAHYALDGLPNKVMAAEYLRTLPDENMLAAKLQATARQLAAAQPARTVTDHEVYRCRDGHEQPHSGACAVCGLATDIDGWTPEH